MVKLKRQTSLKNQKKSLKMQAPEKINERGKKNDKISSQKNGKIYISPSCLDASDFSVPSQRTGMFPIYT
jgi:hypothetical protein